MSSTRHVRDYLKQFDAEDRVIEFDVSSAAGWIDVGKAPVQE